MRKHILVITVTLLASLYALGEIAQQYFLEWPRFIRWHLSDFGCVATGVYVVAMLRGIATTKTIVKIEKRQVVGFAVFFWAAAMVFECFIGPLSGVAHFDIIDVLCYTASLVLIWGAARLDPRHVWEL